MKTFKKTLLGAALTTALLVTSLSASAVQFQLTAVGTGDFGFSYDSGISGGGVITSGLLGNPLSGFSIDTAVNNSPGVPGSSFLDTVYAAFDNGAGGSGGTITIWASATDYMLPVSGTIATLLNTIGGTNVNANVTVQTWVDNTNALMGTSGASITQGPFSAGAFSDAASTLFTVGTPYSITQKTVINVANLGNATGDFNSNVVPEPGSLALIGLGLLAAGVLRRRQS